MDEDETLYVTDVKGMFEMIRSKLAKYDTIDKHVEVLENELRELGK